MIKKTLLIILGIIILLISKLVLYRKDLYLYPYWDDKYHEDFIKTYKVKKFSLIDTLGWYIPGLNSNKIIVFCHGNSFNITWKKYIFEKFKNFFTCPIVSIDYLRTSELSIDTLFSRTEKLIEELFAKGYKTDQIILFGESLGCAITLHVGEKYNIKNIINYIGFRKMSDIVGSKVPYIGNIIKVFVNELDNESKIKSNNFNLTLLNSPEDKLVNFQDIKKLSNIPNVEILEISGSHAKANIPDHVMLRLKEKYFI